MRVRALVATVLAVSLFGGASTASAIHVFVCHDKEAPRPILCPRGCLPTQPVFCDADHPELLLAVNLHGFLRRTPFDGVLFKIEDGKLVVVAAWPPG